MDASTSARKRQEILQRITKERRLMQACQAMKQATGNQDVQADCDRKIRESQKMVHYFEERLQELDERSNSPLTQDGDAGASAKRLPPVPLTGGQPLRSGDLHPPPSASSATFSVKSQNTPPKVHYSNLDLIKADTPLTAAKISRMLHQLDFKITVEKQFKEGFEKMAKLYQADGDKKAKQDAELKRVESNQKMLLLTNALKKYKTLDVMGDIDEDDDSTGDRMGMMRKPLTGAFMVTVLQARDLNRAPMTTKFGRSKGKPESVVVIKIEDTPRARTHPSKNDTWNEQFEIHVDKANEVEVTLYDKVAGETPIPIGLLWIRLSDVAEDLRKKRVGQESAGPGWVPANRVDSSSQPFGAAGAPYSGEMPVGEQMTQAFSGSGSTGPGAGAAANEGIVAWFAVEPEGQIQLKINFVKSNVRKRPLDAVGGLGRQGAVRKRKEEVHEQNGHKFVQKQFYTVILCAYCREFLLNAAGMQCEDCRYVCHKKCFSHVVTKCISKSNAETDADEEKINHRIPHRFEPISSLSPNWCCHCGMILPLSRKKARKCSECDLTAHTECVHLVPDFCGMSMEMANQLLVEVKSIKQHRVPGAAALPRPASLPSVQRLSQTADRMRIDDKPPQLPPSSSLGQQDYAAHRPSTELGPGPSRDEYANQPAYVPTRPPQVSAPSQRQGFPQGQAPSPHPVLPQPPAQQRPDSRYGSQQGLPADPRLSSSQSGRPQPPTGARPVPPHHYQGMPVDPRQQQQAAYAQPQAQQRPQQPYPQQQVPARTPPPQAQYPQQVGPVKQSQQPQYDPRRPPQQVQQQQQQQQQAQRPVRRKVGLDDFNFLAVLGKGNFGKVMLAEEKMTSQLYAIKVLKKDFIIENDEIESTKSEKRVFMTASKERHPFLLGLHSCFQTETRVYFCMEFVSGGDLMLHIQRKQFSPRQAKFYGAEVLLALEYFHKNGVIYRDLKLDNILLTLDGHVKVADYGLCKEDMWFGKTTSTFCGTPEFMAPEILLEQRYGRAVDWWAFGVLIYEMLLGQSPFRGEDEDEIFDAILEDEPLYPMHMPGDSVSLLQKLLTRDPTKRLGSGPDDAEPIKRHAFFRDLNWDDVYHKRIPAPFFPSVSSPTDVSNFDSEFTREKPYLTPVHSQLSAADQREFESFSWISSWANYK